MSRWREPPLRQMLRSLLRRFAYPSPPAIPSSAGRKNAGGVEGDVLYLAINLCDNFNLRHSPVYFLPLPRLPSRPGHRLARGSQLSMDLVGVSANIWGVDAHNVLGRNDSVGIFFFFFFFLIPLCFPLVRPPSNIQHHSSPSRSSRRMSAAAAPTIVVVAPWLGIVRIAKKKQIWEKKKNPPNIPVAFISALIDMPALARGIEPRKKKHLLNPPPPRPPTTLLPRM
jgi:hypothetical protein